MMDLKDQLFYSVLPICGRKKAIKFVDSLSNKKAYYMNKFEDLNHIANLFGLDLETFKKELNIKANDYKELLNS